MRRRIWAAIAASAVVLGSLATAAPAATVGFTLDLSGSNRNLPYVAFKNTSTSALIKDVKFTIGDIRYNFDNALYEGFGTSPSAGGLPTTWTSAPSGSFTQYGPDNNGAGGTRSDYVRYTFPNTTTKFSPGKWFHWRSDVDRDASPSDTTEDYRFRFFDLNSTTPATSDNSLVTVLFSSGQTLSGRIPEFKAPTVASPEQFIWSKSLTLTTLAAEPSSTTLRFAALAPVAVPEPAGALVGVVGMIIAAAVRGRARPNCFDEN